MKILILYFSMSGRTKKVAEKMASDLKSSEVVIERLKYTKKQRNLMFEEDKIKKGDLSNFKFNETILDLEPYDLIILGSPTYGSLPTVAFNGYIENVRNIKGKSLILFNTCRLISIKTFRVLEAEIGKKGGKVVKKQVFKGFFKIGMRRVEKFIDEINQDFLK